MAEGKKLYIPNSELPFHRGSGDTYFAVCNGCNQGIQYPGIKIAGAIEEVEKDAIPLNRYNVTYHDYHVCCAMKKCIEDKVATLRMKHTLRGTNRLTEWFIKKWIKSIDATIDVDVYQVIEEQEDEDPKQE